MHFSKFDQVADASARVVECVVECLDEPSRQAVMAQGHSIGRDAHWLAYSTALDQTVLSSGSTTVFPIKAQVLGGQCFYIFSEYTLSSLAYIWTSYYDSNVIEPKAAQGFSAGYSGVGQAIHDIILNSTDLIFAYQTSQLENLSRVFESTVDSLTVHTRQNSDFKYGLPMTRAIGRENTCAYVYWQRLAFPFIPFLVTNLVLRRLAFPDRERTRSVPRLEVLALGIIVPRV